MDMPHYRLKSFGVEPQARYLIGSWVAEHHGEESEEGDGTMKPFEPDEEERVFAPGGGGAAGASADGDSATAGDSSSSSSSSDGSSGSGGEEGTSAKKPPKPEQPPFDWAAFQAALPGYAAAAWADVKLSAKELFTLDKDESVLTQRVHVRMPTHTHPCLFSSQTSKITYTKSIETPCNGSMQFFFKIPEPLKDDTNKRPSLRLFKSLRKYTTYASLGSFHFGLSERGSH